jgi:hypothetical protein
LSQSADFINQRLFLLFRHRCLVAWLDFRLLSYWGFCNILGRCDGLLQLSTLGWLSHRWGLRLLGFGDVDLFVAEAQLIETLKCGKLKLVHSIVKRRVSGRRLGHRLEDLVHVDGDRPCGLVFELLERFLNCCEGLELGLHFLACLRVFEKLGVLGGLLNTLEKVRTFFEHVLVYLYARHELFVFQGLLRELILLLG